MTTYYTAQPPSDDNVVVKEIEKRTNTKLKITWVSPNSYGDKVNVTMAGGDIPDLLLVTDTGSSTFLNMANQGAFWDITDKVKTKDNFNTFPADTWNNIKIDGKIYGVPRVRPVEGGMIPYVRKDWLDKLGLPFPGTPDELFNTLMAFKEKDPGGVGKDNVIPLTGAVAADNLNQYGWIINLFTRTNTWKLADGKLVPDTLLPEYRDGLLFLNKLFVNKLIPADFAVLKGSQAADLVYQNRAGMHVGTVETSYGATTEIRKTNPQGEMVPFIPKSPNGQGFTTRDSGSFGMYVIPKKTVSADKLEKILDFMNYGSGEEGATLASYGLKDVHYTEKDGFKVTTEQATKDIVAAQAFGQIFMKYDKYMRAYRSGMPKETYESNKKVMDEAALVSAPNPAAGLTSETGLRINADLNKKLTDLRIQIIMGKKPIEDWDKEVAALKTNADYNKMIAEINEGYTKRNQK